jgi:hypothetical protein
MRVGALISAAAALAMLAPSAGGSAAAADSQLELEVLASSENAGPVEWRVWRTTLSGSGAMRELAIHVPDGALDAQALAMLDRPTTIGTATVTQRLSSDSIATGESQLEAAACDPGSEGAVATLQFSASGASPCVAVKMAADGLVLEMNLERATEVIRVDLRFDNRAAAAGPLLKANPEIAVERDTTAAAKSALGSFSARVREVVGGLTQVKLTARANEVVYGQPLDLEGRVLRRGEPSQGERVVLHEFYLSPANTDYEPVAAVTDAGGRFRASIRPKSTAAWGAWSYRRAGAEPRFNLLFAVLPSPFVVHAPRPPMTKRVLAHPARGLVRARIRVQSPIWRAETLWCRLYLGRRQVAFRRFPFNAGTLVFRVQGKRGTQVRAAIGRWEGPLIAPGWSRTIRL